MNPVVEIARLLLEFEIERQKKAATTDIGQNKTVTTATEATPSSRQRQRTMRRRASRNREE